MKIATLSARHRDMVALPTNDVILTSSARRAGYTIARDAAHAAELREAAELAKSEKAKTYLDHLLALPEAQDRPLAAARIASSHTIASMPLVKASLFLSGLPIEVKETKPSMTQKVSPAADALLKRKCEIHLIGLRRKATIGDQAARTQANAIGYALDLHASSTMPFVEALKTMSVDLNALRDGLAATAGRME